MQVTRLLVLLSMVVFLLATTKVRGQKDNLTLAVFISGITNEVETSVFTGDLDGRQFKAAVEIAVETINNHTDILNDYHLQAEFVDSQCSAGPSVRGFIEQVFDPSERIMIIGSDCSIATEPVAELAHFWDLVQISPLSSSINLSNSTKFLRLVPSDAATAEGVVSLMERFNWTRVAVISQQETIFTATFDALRGKLMDIGLNSPTNPREITFNSGDDPRSFVLSLYNSPTRIILLNVYPSYAIEILCQAESLGMTMTNGYLWLIYSWYPDEWWTTPTDQTKSYTPISCSRGQIERVLERSIVIQHFPVLEKHERNITTAAGLTRSQFEVLLTQRLSDVYPDADTSLFNQTHFYFDAVLMASFALNHTQEQFNLTQFSYDRDPVSGNISQLIFDSASNLTFRGMSGLVELDSVRDRPADLRYFQYRRGSNRRLTTVFIGDESNFESASSIFPSGVPMDELYVYISQPLFIVYAILCCVGILLAVFCAVFTLIFRNRTAVKLSSPFVNMLIILGVILFFVDVILYGTDEGTSVHVQRCTVNALCMTRLWIASVAFSLVFGTIFIKTWRVYYTFFANNRRKKGKKAKAQKVKDWVLFLVVCVLVLIDLLFMTIVTAIPETRLVLTDTEVPSNTQALPQIIGMCDAPQSLVWIIILLVYKGLLLIIGLFLAFETRNIKIKQINDSKLIGMSIYGVVILSVASAIIGFLLVDMVDVFYAVVGLMVIIGNTFLLCLLFIPKVYGLCKDPEGLRVFSTSSPELSSNTQASDTKDTIAGLNEEVVKLRKELRMLSGSTTQLLDEPSTNNEQELPTGSDNQAKKTKAVHFTEL